MGPSFPAVLGVSPKSLCHSIRYWVTWLSQKSQDPATRLRWAILSRDIPPHLLHHFACDCVEHSLSLFEVTGHVLPVAWHRAITGKRQWIEGQRTWKDWYKQEALPLREYMHTQQHEFPLNPVRTVHNLSLQDAYMAAYNIAIIPTFPGERDWQLARLTDILHEYQYALERLYALLQHRRQMLHPHLAYWQDTLEANLFAHDEE